jgi:ribosomal protein S18 acetylase RimI-like enzyme
MAQSTLGWEGARVGTPEQPRALFLALFLPGHTALVTIPSPLIPGIDFETQLWLASEGLQRLAGRGLHYAQALAEPQAAQRCRLLEQAGFRPLAPLCYLERDVLYPWVEPPTPNDAEWVAYRPEIESDFADVVSQTYQDSRDCPELSGLRPIGDVLAAHRGVGMFDPRLWELARIDGRYAGCVLLALIAAGAALEIVYLGVVPEARRRGVGTLLLRRAVEHGRRRHARRLTVVVDERNEPARRLYEGFRFMPVARRIVYLHCWK